MSQLLYIESSPRKKRSSSIEVARVFLSAYEKKHADCAIKTLDLWQKDLPPFDGDIIDAKYSIMHGQSHTEAQRKAWHAVEALIAEFKSASAYVFSIPMWNFSIPYRLKHYFDLIVQPSYTFSISPTGEYKGLVVGKPVVLIYSRGGSYGSGTGAESLDLQKTYMESILKFIGFTDIRSLIIEPTAQSEQKKNEVVQKAKEQAVQMAEHL